MPNITLDANSICSIIRECKRSGVAKIQISNLVRVEFTQTSVYSESAQKITKEATLESEKVAEKTLVREEILTKEDKLDHMLIEDPLQYEQLIAMGDLEVAGGQRQDTG